MITEKQRRRALARAKWERQQARRREAERRNRIARIIAGTLVTIVLVGLVGWGVHHLVTSNNTNNTPVPTPFPSNTLTMKTPTNPGFVTSFGPGSPTGPTNFPTSKPQKTTGAPTGPVTTGSTGKASP